MFRFLRNAFNRNRYMSQSRDKVNELMNEVGRELGVKPDTRTLTEDPKQFSERMKRAIQKRT